MTESPRSESDDEQTDTQYNYDWRRLQNATNKTKELCFFLYFSQYKYLHHDYIVLIYKMKHQIGSPYKSRDFIV